ncbi:MAG: MAPEG family protein [Steroidobacteraceae bacterium]
MPYVDIVTALAVLQFIVFGFKVGSARGKFGVTAPATTGNETFERYFRVQQNTLEQLIVFVPSIYIFAQYLNPLWAAALGLVYLVGREVYAAAYVRNPAKRSLGFALTFLPVVILALGGLIGAIWQLLHP